MAPTRRIIIAIIVVGPMLIIAMLVVYLWQRDRRRLRRLSLSTFMDRGELSDHSNHSHHLAGPTSLPRSIFPTRSCQPS